MVAFEGMDVPALPLDPFTYIGRAHRNEEGRVVSLEVFFDTDTVHVEQADEFFTFTTRTLLENPQPKPE